MKIDFEQLQALVSVADSGSFSRAAEQSFITQSAMSKRIAALEQNLDTLLFDRIGHHIQLTEAGRVLYQRAQSILLQLEDTKRVLDNLQSDIRGPLSIGTSHHIGLHRLPPVLRQFTQAYPEVQLNIRFLDSEQGCRDVETGKLEMAIVTLPQNPSPDLQCHECWNDTLVPAVGRHHELRKKKKISIEDLSRYAAILPGQGTFTRSILEQAFGRARLQLQTGLSTNYLETIKMMVSVGLGWSILPETMIDKELYVLPLKTLNLQRPLGVLTHKNRTLSNPARALANTLLHDFKSM